MTPPTTAILKDEKTVAMFEELVARLQENYVIADQDIRRRYGDSPGVVALMLFCLMAPRPSHIRSGFERAILELTRDDPITPNEDDYFDEDSLAE
ncbi:hypothetical protein OH491_16685 [Termitidicoccus mucosus]|uniref:Uncharacterized protein n=1 Tax=Termitidicoccus mucosus TaxID=1184151 RepID=A0A178IK96_9BACT|nr:hypothetical protein AW736_11895 [Opitutaceae bacterium TSB47]